MSESAHPGGHGGFEERDVSFPPIVMTSLILLAVVLLAFVTMWWLLSFLTHKNIERQGPISAVAVEARRAEPPEPRLQSHPLRDLADLRTAEAAVIESYGWIDREAGIVRIPVARALELTAQRGLPAKGAQ